VLTLPSGIMTPVAKPENLSLWLKRGELAAAPTQAKQELS
jgi:hypothetical protein